MSLNDHWQSFRSKNYDQIAATIKVNVSSKLTDTYITTKRASASYPVVVYDMKANQFVEIGDIEMGMSAGNSFTSDSESNKAMYSIFKNLKASGVDVTKSRVITLATTPTVTTTTVENYEDMPIAKSSFAGDWGTNNPGYTTPQELEPGELPGQVIGDPWFYNYRQHGCACCGPEAGDYPFPDPAEEGPLAEPWSPSNPCGWYQRSADCYCRTETEICTTTTHKTWRLGEYVLKYPPTTNCSTEIRGGSVFVLENAPGFPYGVGSPEGAEDAAAPQECQSLGVFMAPGRISTSTNRQTSCVTQDYTDVGNAEYPDKIEICTTITTTTHCDWSGVSTEYGFGCGCACPCNSEKCRGYPCLGPIVEKPVKNDDDLTLGRIDRALTTEQYVQNYDPYGA